MASPEFLRPQVVQARVAVSVRVTHEIVAYLVLVDLAARLPLQAAVDRAEVVAHAATDGALLKADDLRALLGSRACGEQARRARPAHEHLGVHRLNDLVLGNLGLLTQPAVRCRSGLVLLRRRSLRRTSRQPRARKRSGCGPQSQKCAAAQPLPSFVMAFPFLSNSRFQTLRIPPRRLNPLVSSAKAAKRIDRIAFNLTGRRARKSSCRPSETPHTSRVILPSAPSRANSS